jgi:antitoxin component HigA of HigAB toxin-antitoxin module
MPVRTAKHVTDVYFDLVRRFPLRRIRNDEENEAALKMYQQLAMRPKDEPIDSGTDEYLDVLVDLIADYEKRAGYAMDTSHLTAAGVLTNIMQDLDLTVTALAKETGIAQSNLSEMLNGKRDWSKAAIKALCARFKLSADLFLKT